MDPISTVASVVTLLGAAGGSCKFFYEFIYDIIEAPVEIRACNTRLESLDCTLSTLLQIYSSLPQDTPVDTILIIRIQEFLDETKAVQGRVGAISSWTSLGRGQRMRARCRWLATDRRLQKFFASLEQWNTVFSQAMLAVQTKILLDIKEQAASLLLVQSPQPFGHRMCLESWSHVSNNTPTLQPPGTHRAIPHNLHESPHLSKRLARYLTTIYEPAGYQIKRRYRIALRAVTLSLSSGSTIVRRWSADGRETYTILPISEAFSISFTIQVSKLWPHKISLSLHGLYQWASLPKLKLRSILHMSAILPYGSQYWMAVRYGNLELLRHALCLGQYRISDTTIYGDTSLHIATRYQHIDVVNFLLENGADIDATNDRGETPLHLALKHCKDHELPRLLLARGADTYRTDIDGRTPFHTFFSETIRTLIRWYRGDIDVTTQDYQGMTIMHYISRSSRSGSDDIAWCLGNPLPPKDALGRSILHLAAQRGNVPLLNYLLKLPKASDLATPDYMGHTLLHYATESRRVDTIDLLLNAGYGDIHLKDLKGRTLMQHAASRGNIYAVQRLIELGADNSYNISNKNGRTTIQVANEFIAKECLDIESSIKEVKEDIIKSKKEGYLPHSVTVGRAVFTSLLLILTWWFIY